MKILPVIFCSFITIRAFVANNYFQFKQFTVYQEACAMKVCTDACIFGAYVATMLHKKQPFADQILDIGAGTGLLSLMMAQQTTGKIDAIEIEEAAFTQACENIEQSPWKEKISILNQDALAFNPEKKYDCIVSNPPFFEGDLKSGNQKKDAAKHDSTLTLEQLLWIIDRHLSSTGSFAVLLPYHRLNYFIEIAKDAKYSLNESLLVQHTEAHPFFRGILLFSKTDRPVKKKELAIKNKTGNYTAEFCALLEPYYLHL